MLEGLIHGTLLWGAVYTIFGFVFKDKIAKNVGMGTLGLAMILIIIA